MLDVIALILLWRINGANAAARGKSKRQYQFLTIILWFGFEMIGSMIGILIWPDAMTNQMSLMYAVAVSAVFAILGGYLSYRFAKKGPIVESHNQERIRNSYEWNSRPGSYSFNENNIYGGEMLSSPATVRIIDELGGNGAQQTFYYMNGQPVCALYPGMEAVLKTRYVKNIVTISSPDCDKADTKHGVRFIAAENGSVEIHSSSGEFIPELFKNYSSN